MTSLTRLIDAGLEAALAQHVVLTVRSLPVLVVPAWRRRGHKRLTLELELDRLTLDLTPDILELVPHPQIPGPEQAVEQAVTARRNPSAVAAAGRGHGALGLQLH